MTVQSPSRHDPDKRRRLVESAAALFSRSGFEGVGVDDIASRAGVAKGTVYLYFQSKADLFRAVLIELGERLNATSLEQPAPTGDDVLRHFVRRHLALADESPDLFRLYVSALFGVNRDFQAAALETFDSQRRQVERTLSRGTKNSKAIQRRASLFVGSMLAAALLRGLEGAPRREAFRDEDALIALVMEGDR
jgi:AcrR family transcriptional regulator